MRNQIMVEKVMVQIGMKIAKMARNDASLLMCYQIEESEDVRRRIDAITGICEEESYEKNM